MGCICMNEPGEEGLQKNHIITNCTGAANRGNNQEERSRRINNNNNHNAHATEVLEYHQRHIEPYLQSLNDIDFNFKEVEDKYVGEGLKKMKGYICPISKEELMKKRKAFWETRIEGNKETWQFLREICENPEFQNEDIREYLTATGIVPYKKCLNVTYDTFGGLYEIPNYCIHDPVSYDLPEDHKVKPQQIDLTLKVGRGGEQMKITTNNYALVSELKKAVFDKSSNTNEKEKIKQNKIALFFGGKEMKDDKPLWIYNIIEDAIVLLTIKS